MSMANSDPHTDRREPRLPRIWLLAAGWLLFTLGLIGVILPVMPTTVFWIGAVWCWSRSAPHLTRRILSHPRFGQSIHLFVETGMMTRNGKWLASGGIATGYLLLHLLSTPAWPLSLLLGLTLLLVATWLWRRPEPGLQPFPQPAGMSMGRAETPLPSTRGRSVD